MPTVLVVEDDPSIVGYLEYHLRSSNYEVMTASTVREAWALVTEIPPHAAIVDIQLPGVYGWELVRRIRNDLGLRNTPVIICSGVIGDKERAEAESLNCELMTKPFEIDEVLERVKVLIERGRRVEVAQVKAVLLLDAYRIEGIIHLPPQTVRFSDAWEDIVSDERTFIPITDARITSAHNGQEVGSPDFLEVHKADVRAVYPLD